MLTELRAVYHRDLEAVGNQIQAYPDDASLWRLLPGWTNSGGTLVLHIVGNLRFYIGAQIGGTGYVRDRPMEFGARDLSRRELQELVDLAQAEVATGLKSLSPDALIHPSQAPIGEGSINTGLWLMHLSLHLAYHLGQLDYHRRAVTQDPSAAGALSLVALAER